MSRDNLRRTNMFYDATSQQHHSYPHLPPIHNSIPSLVLSDLCEDSLNRDPCYSDCPVPSSEGRLAGSLYVGSAPIPDYTFSSRNQATSTRYPNRLRMETSQNDCSSSQSSWDPSAALSPSTSTPMARPRSQSLSCRSNKEFGGGAVVRTKPSLKRTQGSSSSKRPTIDDFRKLILRFHDYVSLLYAYVGTDSRYTLAKNHAAMIVRERVKSQEIENKMREVFEPLDLIDTFLGYLLEHQEMKQEQKGCVALRICMGALAALLGEFGQGNAVENFASDPHAPIVSREYLGRFRTFNPNLCDVLRRLSTKLEKSMNMYRHRRSPSSSLVAKFQEMSDTLDVWNGFLMDDTFLTPFRIASDWLKNHPNQVEGRRRNQAYSEQASPSSSDTNRPSPTQYDSNYLSAGNLYGDISRSPNRSAVRQPAMDPVPYESLFRSGPPTAGTGVTYFGSNSMPASSMSFHGNIYRTASGLDDSLNLPSLTGEFGFVQQGHPANTGQYQGTGPGYSPY
ncbi:unnamed protein product [Rhizoctonia solani]|uniref:Uncharacterized protein n=1 Tax=Rhizoctonia solani TaxID=456999 RepID=A0A8H2WEM5_9AGAM|nr:unnamed protein product [Rhizoctonia solani]